MNEENKKEETMVEKQDESAIQKGNKHVEYLNEVKCTQCGATSDSVAFITYNWLTEKASFIYECRGYPRHDFLVMVAVPCSEAVNVGPKEEGI